MARFVFVFTGGAPKEDQRDENMKDWGAWIADLSGKGVYDSGVPFGPGRKEVSADGSVKDISSDNSGYALIKADSMEQALDLAKTGPNQKYGGTTQVYEVMEMPGMPS